MTSTRSSTTATTPRSSIELAKESFKVETESIASSTTAPSRAKSSIWTLVKQHLKEHHKSVNAAFAIYYGHGYENRVSLGGEHMTKTTGRQSEGKAQEVWVYQRGVYGRS